MHKPIQVSNARHSFYEMQKLIQPYSTIEIGACEAEFSCEMLEVLNNKNIFAVEANPAIYNKISNEKVVILDNEIRYENLLISDHTGEDIFNYQGPIENNAHATNSILWKIDNYFEKHPQTMVCMTLDDYAKSRSIKGSYGLWIDVEGANKHVLIGGIQTLRDTTSIHIEIETEPIWEGQWIESDISEFLARYGFIQLGYQQQGEFQKDAIYIKEDLLSERIVHCLSEFAIS